MSEQQFHADILRTWGISSVWIELLVVAMGVDITLGLLKALVRKKLDSSVGRIGMVRKVATLLLVFFCCLADGVLPDIKFEIPYLTAITGVKTLICTVGGLAAFGFLVIELISICEKLPSLNVWLPPRLRDSLRKVKAEMDADLEKAASTDDATPKLSTSLSLLFLLYGRKLGSP